MVSVGNYNSMCPTQYFQALLRQKETKSVTGPGTGDRGDTRPVILNPKVLYTRYDIVCTWNFLHTRSTGAALYACFNSLSIATLVLGQTTSSNTFFLMQ